MKRKEIRIRLGISYLLLREYVKKAHIKPVIILNFHFPVDVNPPFVPTLSFQSFYVHS